MKKIVAAALIVLSSLFVVSANAADTNPPVPTVATPVLSPADCVGWWWINLTYARLVTTARDRQPILPAFLTVQIQSGQVNSNETLSCYGVVSVSGNSGVNIFVSPSENKTYVDLSMPASVIDGENPTHSISIHMELLGVPSDNILSGFLTGSFRNNLATTPKERTPFIFHGDGDFNLMQRGNPDDGQG